MPIAQRHICLYILDSTFIQDSGVAKWWMCSHTWVVCELSPCHVGLHGEEGGIFHDTKVHRYRQYESQSIFNNICRIFSMALLYPLRIDADEIFLKIFVIPGGYAPQHPAGGILLPSFQIEVGGTKKQPPPLG